MIPQIENINFTKIAEKQPSKTYYLDLENNRIVGMIDGIEAVKQAITKIILTEKYAHIIYDWFYGIGIQKYIGKPFDLIAADIQNNVGNALQFDNRVLTVNSVELKRVGVDSCYIVYDVTTTEGEAQDKVKVL